MRMISVVDENWGVGREEALLFYIPKDMRFFKKTTTGNVVVMGKNTLLSFPGQKPLKDRVNIVLSSAPIEKEGVVQCYSMGELMEEIAKYDPDTVFLIGGASMYDQLADCCTEALITRVDAVGDADRSIQSFDDRPNWELVDASEVQEDNGFRFVFTRYVNHDVKERPDGVPAPARPDEGEETAEGEAPLESSEAIEEESVEAETPPEDAETAETETVSADAEEEAAPDAE